MLLQKWAPSFFSHFPAQSPLHTKKSPDTVLSLSLFFLAMLGLRCFFRLSLVVASRSSFPVVVQGLFTVVSSLVAEHGLQGVWAP